ncbi:MAG: hypothetical protein U0441_17340 [Polyangiaceae bacterium]
MADKPKSEETPVPSAAPVPKAVISKIERRVRWACIWSLVALGLITWALVHPKPLPVIVAMSVGQMIGTLSLLLFLGSIALDIRANYRLTRRAEGKPEKK